MDNEDEDISPPIPRFESRLAIPRQITDDDRIVLDQMDIRRQEIDELNRRADLGRRALALSRQNKRDIARLYVAYYIGTGIIVAVNFLLKFDLLKFK